MKEKKLELLTPLFLKYQTEFEKNSKSRVFAPLAESYRKVGMVDKAIEILATGIRHNPQYIMGYLGLAFCYFDLKQYTLAYNTLRPLVENNRDNIRLQKLFADTCLFLGYDQEALETLKYLLFINSKDKVIADLVTTLENKIDEKYKVNHVPIIIPEEELTSKKFEVENLKASENLEYDFDDWLTVNFNTKKETSSNELETWNMKKIISTENLQNESEHYSKNKIESEETQGKAPFVTHTLVDLYCGQGHIEKAIEVLEKILELNPKDQRTIDKLSEIKSLMAAENFDEYESEVEDSHIIDDDEIETRSFSIEPTFVVPSLDLKDVTEEEGRQNLMNIIDEKFHQNLNDPINKNANSAKNKLIEDKLLLFLQKIQQRALAFQSGV